MILTFNIVDGIPYTGTERLREAFGQSDIDSGGGKFLALEVDYSDDSDILSILGNVPEFAAYLGYSVRIDDNDENHIKRVCTAKEALKFTSLYFLYVAASKFASTPAILVGAIDTVSSLGQKKDRIINFYLSIRLMVASVIKPSSQAPEWLYKLESGPCVDTSFRHDIKDPTIGNSSEVVTVEPRNADNLDRIATLYIHLKNVNLSKLSRLCIDGFVFDNIEISPSKYSLEALDKSIKSAQKYDKVLKINLKINSGIKHSDILDMLNKTGAVKVINQVTKGYSSSLSSGEVKYDEWVLGEDGNRGIPLYRTNQESPKNFNLEIRKF